MNRYRKGKGKTRNETVGRWAGLLPRLFWDGGWTLWACKRVQRERNDIMPCKEVQSW